jgi:hypothetical protein
MKENLEIATRRRGAKENTLSSWRARERSPGNA